MHPWYLLGVEAAREKYALSRGRAFARTLTQQASEDPTLIKARDAAINRFYGTRVLGKGLEGTAYRVMRPTGSGTLEPRAVKAFNSESRAYSPELIARKEQLAPALARTDKFTTLHNAYTDPASVSLAKPEGVRVHESEFVPGRSAPVNTDTQHAARQAEVAAIKAGRTQGMKLRPTDIRPGNMIVDPRTNKPKVVDFLPTTRGEAMDPKTVASLGQTGKAGLFPTTAGANLFPNLPKQDAPMYDILAQSHAHLRDPRMRMHQPIVAPLQPRAAPPASLAPTVVKPQGPDATQVHDLTATRVSPPR